MKRTGIIMQARMSSNRMPGKNLIDLAGKPVLWHSVVRCMASENVDKVIVATSDLKSDDAIEWFCKEHNFLYFRGSLDDVLLRYYECAKEYNLDYIVRVGGCSPLLDASVIDRMLEAFWEAEKDGVAYMANVMDRVYPRGLDAEVFTMKALEETAKNASTEEEHEHVTPYMRRYLKTKPYTVEKDLQADYRLTIDEIDDYRIINEVFKEFYREGEFIDMRKVIRFLDKHPEIANINAHVEQTQVSY